MTDIVRQQLQKLKTELVTDPKGLGYTDGSQENVDDIIDANLLNDNTLGKSTLPVEKFTPAQVRGAFAVADLKTLDNNQLQRLRMELQIPELDFTHQTVKDNLLDLFGAGTVTRQNLIALQTRPASRGEELFGEGIEVGYWHVSQARQLP